MRVSPVILLPALMLFASNVCASAEPVVFENELLRLRLVPRTHDQMAGFYEARGFPAPMIEALRPACFFTVGIHNKSGDILWLDLANWQFSTQDKPVKRIHRAEWKQRWQDMQIPLASQSTFRWTLLPEQLDFHAGEREGGNITLQRTDGRIHLDAVFERGMDKTLPPLRLRLDNIACAENTP